MNKANGTEVLFEELCDEHIAYVSGGVTATAMASEDSSGTRLTATLNPDDGTNPQTVTLNYPNKQQPLTGSALTAKLLSSVPPVYKQLVSTILLTGGQPIQ